ncbi:MAG: EpsG family protein [Candidatus Electrothrix sp. AS4_5]|nr:EpsG family protein [Candidatus Electrothrix gigas]
MKEYIIFYIAEFFLLILSSYSKKNTFFWVAVLLSVLFAGFRHDVGYDYLNYKSMYSYPEIMSSFELEPLFKLSIYLIRLITKDYHFFFFFYSLATCLFIAAGMRKLSSYPEYSYLIYLLIPSLYLTSFSIVRFALAAAITFYGLTIFLENEGNSKKVPLLFILLAFGFHYSAILLIPLLFAGNLLRMRYSDSFHLFFIISSFLLYYTGLSNNIVSKILFFKYSVYTKDMGDSLNFKIIALFLFYFIVLIESKYIEQTFKNNFMINIFLISSLLTISLFEYPHVARFGYYLTLFQTILIPKFFFSKRIKSRGRAYWKYLFLTGITSYYLFMPYYILHADLTQNIEIKFTPYKNYLFLF